MSTSTECPFCATQVSRHGRQASSPDTAWHDEGWFDCPQCGTFGVTDAAWDGLRRRGVTPALVSSWIRQQFDQGLAPVRIRAQDVDRLTALQFPSFKERVESYLLAAAERLPSLGATFLPFDPPLIATACCSSSKELEVIVDYLKQKGLLKSAGHALTAGPHHLTPEGHIYADDLRTQRAASSQGFIAMWFDKAMEDARRSGFEPGIRNAGYKPHRVDDAQHIDKIDDRIIAEIRRSKFVVADLTAHRNNVYFEAGFAAGLGKPVFYTCRGDHAEAIHFDIRQFNYIKWDTPAELAERLQERIEAVLGAGPEAV